MRRPFTFESFMNKLRPGAIAQIDPGEDGMLRTSNVTKFHESCFANGLPLEDIFLRDELIDATSDYHARSNDNHCSDQVGRNGHTDSLSSLAGQRQPQASRDTGKTSAAASARTDWCRLSRPGSSAILWAACTRVHR